MGKISDSTGGAFGCPALTLTILLVATAFASLLAGPASAADISRTEHTSAEVCAYCHVDIYNSWKQSVHSRSYTNPIFLTAYRHAYLDTKGAAADFCLKCHAPTVLSSRDTAAAMPVTAEGVTCDFCHTIEKVDIQNPAAPFKLDVGGEKRASMMLLKNKRFVKNEAAHVASYTEWFNKAELCAGCHEITNLKGLKIGETYSEWKASGYASEGIQCQGCHMPLIEGKAIDPSVKTPKSGTIPDHSLAHNVATLKGSVGIEVIEAKRTGDGMYSVDLAVTNVKAGHNLPTGTPSRMLAVAVTIQSGKSGAVTMTRRFGKVIADAEGARLETDVDGYLKGVTIVKNTALKPEERRVVNFLFSVPPSGEITVSARAFLIYKAVVTHRETVDIPL